MSKPKEQAVQAFTVETRAEEELEHWIAAAVADYERMRKEFLERQIARDQERTESAHIEYCGWTHVAYP